MAREESTQKIGAGHASAMFRQGLAELRAAAFHPESNVAQPTVYGIYGTKTPGEVMQERQGESRDPDEQPSILEERLKQAEQQRDAEKGREPEPPQQERD
ncbi:MAG: hypothetical protein EDS66_17190 [Planctomycetota bacterium]|nr:MAG: hypothetical protein EDS66_17190 [Planctomycetota bacterium]